MSIRYLPPRPVELRAPPAFPVPARVELIGPTDVARPDYEDYIGRVFALKYGARLGALMPELMGLRAEDGRLLAALGLRRAAHEPLFLECYLDEPVEETLGARLAPFGAQVTRGALVEVGNLATGGPGGSRWLIVALTGFLQGAGEDWVVFTARPELRNAFRRLGLRLIALAPARAERLPSAARAAWGRYYDNEPQVVAVNVQHAYGVLERYLRSEWTLHALQGVWQHAYAAGSAQFAPQPAPEPYA